MNRDGYSTREVSRSTGVTLRQLQYWHEQGYIVPQIEHGQPGPGGRVRRYSERQLRTIARIEALRKQHRFPLRDFPLGWVSKIKTVRVIHAPTLIGSTLFLPVQAREVNDELA